MIDGQSLRVGIVFALLAVSAAALADPRLAPAAATGHRDTVTRHTDFQRHWLERHAPRAQPRPEKPRSKP